MLVLQQHRVLVVLAPYHHHHNHCYVTFFSHDHQPYPSMYWVHSPQHCLLDSHCHCYWHWLGQTWYPLLTKPVFFVAFNSIARSVYNEMKHFIGSGVPCRRLGGEIRHIQNSAIFSTFRTPKYHENGAICKEASTSPTTSWTMWSRFPVFSRMLFNWVAVYLHQNAQSGVKSLVVSSIDEFDCLQQVLFRASQLDWKHGSLGPVLCPCFPASFGVKGCFFPTLPYVTYVCSRLGFV